MGVLAGTGFERLALEEGMTKRFVPIALALAAAAATLGAQQEGSVAQFTSGVQLVEVYATVTDEKGELYTGLRREDFEVY